MSEKQYLIAKARCLETRETVKSQNLSQRYRPWEKRDCQIEADYLAERLNKKTGRNWVGFVEAYSLEDDVNHL